MKKILALLAIILISNTFYAKGFSVKHADELNPSQRMKMSEAWAETGQAYMDAGDKKNAKASLIYSVEWYPMGVEAQKVRVQLMKNFKVSMVYNVNTEFKKYVDRGNKLAIAKHKLNNYLMALEAKQDADVMYLVAVQYNDLGQKDKAAEYLKKAIAAGYAQDKVDSSLSNLLGM